MGETRVCGRLAELDTPFWRGNASLHLPSAGAARPWICRGFEHPILVILPNTRFVRDFAADAGAMNQYAEIPSVSELSEMPITPFSADTHAYEAAKASRGEALGRWNDTGGILLATPGSLMGPLSTGGDRVTLAVGAAAGRSVLLEWMSFHGYEKTDIVWTPGQFTCRGGIVDFFDPSYPWPIRVEFFDDDIESMRYFAGDTQRSVAGLTRVEVMAISSRRTSKLTDFFPPAMHVMYVEPADLDNAADSYAWMSSGIETAPGDVRAEWLDIEHALGLFPRVRLTVGVERTEIKSG
ncbi:MAG: hypothetical protein LBU13_02840, partial [Synergistaceae bacterium]|nr:hypothetical protein [Synergistaceae bacterium]